jgi:signal transduction histidine kinase
MYLGSRSGSQGNTLLWRVVALAALATVGVVSWILRDAYKHAAEAHTRRQIRLIANTCLSVVLIDAVLFVIPRIAIGQPLVDADWSMVIGGFIPLSYLVGGVKRDLYRPDHVISWIFLRLLTIVLLTTAIVIAISSLSISGGLAAFVGPTCFVAAYTPLRTTLERALQPWLAPIHVEQTIKSTTNKLTRTLDAQIMITAVVNGVREAFGEPALALYQGDIDGRNILSLKTQQRMSDLPAEISPGVLTTALLKAQQVIDKRTLYSSVQSSHLTLIEQQLLATPRIALWCPIVHSQDHLLGLLLLGMRSDHDAYRTVDQQNLQQIVDAAALAFEKSEAMAQRSEAEEVVRSLYQQQRKERYMEARRIAQQLHDEVLNEVALPNLYDLQSIEQDINDPDLRARITKVIAGERILNALLRDVCEALDPISIDDPEGLPDAIQTQLEKVERSWSGRCHFQSQGHPLPLSAEIQREALLITQEALTNVVKHAMASNITVSLHYPEAVGENMILEIADDGRSGARIAPKAKHRGIFYMKEAARSVQGKVEFVTHSTGGTSVVCTFPARYNAEEDRN